MYSATSYVAGGLAAVLAMGLGPIAVPTSTVTTRAEDPEARVPATIVDRTRKGDLPALRAYDDQTRAVADVEVIGLQDSTVIYRDAAGRVLFRADPATRTTTVAKGAVLPAITIRGTDRPRPEPQPRSPPPLQTNPNGCDHALPGRCLAMAADARLVR
jgi:hypothetical protein